MLNFQEKEVNVFDGKISVCSVGEGPMIVFIAGGPGISGPLYQETLAELAKTNTLVFWSYAGCGKSKVDGRSFSVTNDYNDLTAVIATISKPIILMGHSYGGLLAIRYAANHPEEVLGLTLINSMPSFCHADKSMQKKVNRLTELDLLNTYMNLGEKVFSESATKNEMTFFWEIETLLQVNQKKHAFEISKKLNPFFSILTKMQSELLDVNYSNDLRALTIPILMTSGSFDLVALDRPQEMHSWMPNSTYHEYFKSGHFPFLEENDLFIERTSTWLKKI